MHYNLSLSLSLSLFLSFSLSLFNRRQSGFESQTLGNEKGQFQSLCSVEPRIAKGLVAQSEGLFRHIGETSDAFRHIGTSHFQMHSAGVRTHFLVHVEKGPELVTDLFKAAGLEPILCLVRVAVHRIGNPQHRLALSLDSPNQTGKVLAQLVGTHSHHNRETTGDVVGVHSVNNAQQLFGRTLVTNLDTERIANATGKLQMSTVQLTGALPHPQHVRRTIVPTIRRGILTSQGLFVVQQQTLVGRKEISLGKRLGRRVDPNGLHETKTLVHLVGKLAVPAE